MKKVFIIIVSIIAIISGIIFLHKGISLFLEVNEFKQRFIQISGDTSALDYKIFAGITFIIFAAFFISFSIYHLYLLIFKNHIFNK